MVERGTTPGLEWLEAQGDVAELRGTRVLPAVGELGPGAAA